MQEASGTALFIILPFCCRINPCTVIVCVAHDELSSWCCCRESELAAECFDAEDKLSKCVDIANDPERRNALMQSKFQVLPAPVFHPRGCKDLLQAY